MSNQETHYHNCASAVEQSVESHLFGKPCYKIGKKAFCCFYEEEMVFKLNGKNHEKALKLEGSKLFDPSKKGRPMKEWVQVSFAHKSTWKKFAQAAAEYVGG